jgi:hypothetical protein
MATLCGGHSAGEVTQEVKDLVNHNVAGINSKLGTSYTSFTVNHVETQVVAGTNYTVQLTSNDGHPVTARIYVPLPHTNAPAEVSAAVAGHVAANAISH